MATPTTPLSKIELAVEMVMRLNPTDLELDRICGKLGLEAMMLRPISHAKPMAKKVTFSR